MPGMNLSFPARFHSKHPVASPLGAPRRSIQDIPLADYLHDVSCPYQAHDCDTTSFTRTERSLKEKDISRIIQKLLLETVDHLRMR